MHAEAWLNKSQALRVTTLSALEESGIWLLVH